MAQIATSTAGLGPSLVRTLVPIIIGPVVARLGINPEDPTVLLLASGTISYLYYVLVRVLETKAPQLGYFLGVAKSPVYSPKSQVSPGPGEALSVEVVSTEDSLEKQPGVPAFEFEDGDEIDSTTITDPGAPEVVVEVQN